MHISKIDTLHAPARTISRWWLVVLAAALLMFAWKKRSAVLPGRLNPRMLWYWLIWKFYQFKNQAQDVWRPKLLQWAAVLQRQSQVLRAKAESNQAAAKEQILGIRRPSYLEFFLSLLAEEGIKRIHPVTKHVFVWTEFLVKLSLFGVTPRTVGLAGSSVVMHYVAAALPYFQGVAFHGLWNAIALFGTPVPIQAGSLALLWPRAREHVLGSEWDRFRGAVYEEPWSQRLYVPSVKAVTTFAPCQGIVPKEGRPWFVQKELDPGMEIVGDLREEEEPPITEAVYFYLPVDVPLYSPGRTDANLKSLIYGRMCIQPPLDPKQQAENWQGVPILIRRELAIDRETSLPIWLDHVKKDGTAMQYARLLRARDEVALTGIRTTDKEYRSIKIMVKTDEVLFRMKPRPIQNISPKVQWHLGCEVYEATARLKEQWNWDSEAFVVGRWRIFPAFGSAFTDAILSLWMERASTYVNYTAYVLVAGDDSLVVTHAQGRTLYWEGDATMYDQTQSTGPLEHQYRAMRKLGVSDEVCHGLRVLAKAKWVFPGRHGRTVVLHPDRPMRATGGADTTFGNSINMAHAWTFVITTLRVWTTQAVEERFLFLGFSMKLRIHQRPDQPTFLKGKWYVVSGRLIWGPLPSRILKMGKTLVDPRCVYHDVDYARACAAHARDVAQSVRGFLLVPLVKEWVDKFPSQSDTVGRLEPWKVHPGFAEHPGVVDSYDSILERYGWDITTLDELRRQIREAPLFSFLQHPGYADLARVDYG